MARQGTSWLKYITLEYRPILPSALAEFLGDAVNRDEVASRYLAEPERWHLAVKVPLPLAGTIAFVLDGAQTAWFDQQRTELGQRLIDAPSSLAFSEIRHWRSELASSPLPLLLVEEVEYLISEVRFNIYGLRLQGASMPQLNATT
jgi:hypothetical protein